MPKKASIRQSRYDATHCKQFSLKFHMVKDAAIIAQLEKQPSKQAYIRGLISADIAAAQEEQAAENASTGEK